MSHRNRLRTQAACLLAALGISGFQAVSAQPVEPRPTVTKASDLIAAYPARVAVGTNVVFQRKNPGAGAGLAQAGLQVRVFALDDGQLRPAPVSTIGDCEIFLSSVHQLKFSHDGQIQFVTLNQAWIDLSNSGNSAQDTTWFLVFERSGPTHEQFRIKAADVPAYFDTGFKLTVFDNGSVDIRLIETEWNWRRHQAARLYAEVDARSPGIPCYRYSRLTAALERDDGDSLLALAGHCPETPQHERMW
jgi:hypothetical protein